MSADTRPVILITNGATGLEYRIAVAQAWENAWRDHEEGDVLDVRYVVGVFANSPVVASTIEEARQALEAYIISTGWPIEYDEEVLDLSVTRPATNLERYLGITPTFTFQNLVEQAEQSQALGLDPHFV